MFDGIKKIFKRIKELNISVTEYQKDTVIQSLPVLGQVYRAKRYIESGDLDRAENILKHALDINPNNALVYKYLGTVYERKSEHALAVENYQRSADLNPQDKVIWQRLGFSLVAIKEYERAIKSFENADKISFGSTDTYTGWGMALLRQKKLNEARSKLQEALGADKYNFWALFLSAMCDIELETYDMAETKLALLVSVAPNAANVLEYARLKFIKKDYEFAIMYAQKSLKYNSLMIPAYVLLGSSYAHVYDIENSLKNFDIAKQNGADNYDYYHSKGFALNLFGMHRQAYDELKLAREINPESLPLELALSCVMIDELDEGQRYVDEILKNNPECVEVKKIQGLLCYKKGDYKDAIKFLRVNDDDALNCYYLAKCYEALKNDRKPREYYESSLRLNPKYRNVYLDYVNYLISREDYDGARLKLRKALRNYKDDIEFLNLLFFVSYKLVNKDVSEYNIREALSVVEEIEKKDASKFNYPAEKQKLTEFLAKRK